MGVPVLSDCPIDLSGDLSDFLKAHIEKLTESDDVKLCRFGNDSPVKQLLEQCTPETFVETSRQLAQLLYDIMNANINIPPADVAVVVFSSGGSDYLALLKMNYKTSYTHLTKEQEGKNANSIILQKALLPGQGQKLSEAFVVNLGTGELLVTEKKYEVNGEKRLYFSELYLECHAPLSQKSKLDIVTRAVEQVNRKYYGDDDAERKWKIKMSFTRSWRRRAPSRWNLSVKRFFQTARKCRLPLMRKWRNTICPTRQSSPKMSRR